MGFDNAYEGLAEADDDLRWAFGTGFADPFAGLDVSIPDGVDGAALAEYCLLLGDDALIMSHRLQQWLTRAPELEEETALANIALDLLGQARLLYTRAGTADGSGRDEDAYAYGRYPAQFRNVRFVEASSPDFAVLVFRLLVFSSFRLAQFAQLARSADPVIAAVAAKGVPEVTYHRDYAAAWVLRLGDGTEYSRTRMGSAANALLPLVSELYAAAPVEVALAQAGVAIDPDTLRDEVHDVITTVLARTDFPISAVRHGPLPASGRLGDHTPELAEILAELQSVAREHEGATW